MSIFERLQSMPIDDLTTWLNKNVQFDFAPWTLWFDKKYCKHCPHIICKDDDSSGTFPMAWCEVYETCKFFPDFNDIPMNEDVIKMWLESEGE